MKVIFLDIDGVLNSLAYDQRRNINEQSNIDETRLPFIKEIVAATNAVIVLSSTWREHWDKSQENRDVAGQYIQELFSKYGLSIYDKTPVLGYRSKRKDEIKQWLINTSETIESFVIIDDYRFGWEEYSEQLILTNPNFGLGIEKEHVLQAISLLNGITK